MKFCWDNVENIVLTNRNHYYDTIKKRTHYYGICKSCGYPFLGKSRKSQFCCKVCTNLGRTATEKTRKKLSIAATGRKHTEEAKEKISKWFKRKKLPEETRKKMSLGHIGNKLSEEHKKNIGIAALQEKHHNWKGGYAKSTPLYDTYADRLKWIEEVRRGRIDSNILEVKCFKCKKWFTPKQHTVFNRLAYLNGNPNYKSENNFYCSDTCKSACSIYHKSANGIMKHDALMAGRLSWLKLDREVQPEIRAIVFKRDKYTCVKCNSTKALQCHHIFPIYIEPILSADIDNCITLCKNCHNKVHKIDGCRYEQLHMNEC